MQRPEFDSIKDYAEFSKYYWYRDELIKICKAHGLKADGSKIELNKVVEAYFSGEKILPNKKKQVRTQKKVATELTLNTGLIECGFTFGNRFREFFKQQTGEDDFKFNVDMVATAKAVKESGDESFTLGDLLDIYYDKKTYATYDKSALQWNRFVKDFCEDEATKVFPERLKAAAALWKIVRESDMKKEYSHDLFEKYMDEIGLAEPYKPKIHHLNEEETGLSLEAAGKIIAACGNDCAACPRYITHPYEKTAEELQHTAQLWMEIGYRDHIVTNEEISCTGCEPENWCRYRVVKCCQEKGIGTCGDCLEYPCDNMKECFEVTRSFEPTCRKICSDKEYESMKTAFFEKEKNLNAERKRKRLKQSD